MVLPLPDRDGGRALALRPVGVRSGSLRALLDDLGPVGLGHDRRHRRARVARGRQRRTCAPRSRARSRGSARKSRKKASRRGRARSRTRGSRSAATPTTEASARALDRHLRRHDRGQERRPHAAPPRRHDDRGVRGVLASSATASSPASATAWAPRCDAAFNPPPQLVALCQKHGVNPRQAVHRRVARSDERIPRADGAVHRGAARLRARADGRLRPGEGRARQHPRRQHGHAPAHGAGAASPSRGRRGRRRAIPIRSSSPASASRASSDYVGIIKGMQTGNMMGALAQYGLDMMSYGTRRAGVGREDGRRPDAHREVQQDDASPLTMYRLASEEQGKRVVEIEGPEAVARAARPTRRAALLDHAQPHDARVLAREERVHDPKRRHVRRVATTRSSLSDQGRARRARRRAAPPDAGARERSARSAHEPSRRLRRRRQARARGELPPLPRVERRAFRRDATAPPRS